MMILKYTHTTANMSDTKYPYKKTYLLANISNAVPLLKVRQLNQTSLTFCIANWEKKKEKRRRKKKEKKKKGNW